MNPVQFCGFCNNECNLLCCRCQVEFYCSKSCQVADFPRHRTQCFSLPALIPGKKGGETVAASPSPKAESNVSLVQPNKQQEQQQQPPPPEMIKCKISENSMPPAISDAVMRKGKKQVANNSNTSVTENPNLTSVTGKAAEQQQKQTPARQLTPAFDPGLRTAAPNDYKQMPPVTAASRKQEEKPRQPQQEFIEDESHSIIQKVRRNQQTILSDRPLLRPERNNRVFISDLKRRFLEKRKLTVAVQNGYLKKNLLYVIQAGIGVEEFMEHIETNIRKWVEKDRSTGYKPQKDEVILALFQGDYYRAVCLGIDQGSPDTYRVFFIDYGNSEAGVKEDEMKPLGPTLQNEIVLNAITITNLPPNVKDYAKVFSSEFEIEVLSRDENTHIHEVRVCAFP